MNQKNQSSDFFTFWNNAELRGIFPEKNPNDSNEQYREKSKLSFVGLVNNYGSALYSFIQIL